MFEFLLPVVYSLWTFAPWQWEYDVEFDARVTQATLPTQAVGWVTSVGEPMVVSGEIAPNTGLDRIVTRVETGEVVGHVSQLVFRDPDTFRAGTCPCSQTLSSICTMHDV